MTQNVNKEQIQGLLIRGYGRLEGALYALLKVENAERAKAYLQSLTNGPKVKIANCGKRPDGEAINIAFTSTGLTALKLSDKVLKSFPREYIEGLNDDVRKVLLGDIGANDPKHWIWGGNNPNEPDKQVVHILFMVYGTNQARAQEVYHREKLAFSEGISEILVQEGCLLPNSREHFGFKDGISKPAIQGLHPKMGEFADQALKTGEFVLGYENEYGNYSEGPVVEGSLPNGVELPLLEGSTDTFDLGKNGSFLVYRQMTQDVPAFWNYLSSQGKDDDEAIEIGSKMVGRWPSGTALRVSPKKDDPTKWKTNNFLYWDEDKDGLQCPHGAHIRRTNPRDWLYTEKSKKVASEMIRKHAILRRARAYGAPLTPDMETKGMIAASKEQGSTPDEGKRGLHFIALVGHINRQFEFVQNAWVKAPAFGGLREETDPIIGPRNLPENSPNTNFSCPAEPIRKQYHNLPQFTKIVGGAYFFLPGIDALKYISH